MLLAKSRQLDFNEGRGAIGGEAFLPRFHRTRYHSAKYGEHQI
jgi:hypothetical protein